jgi:hypothetical protein
MENTYFEMPARPTGFKWGLIGGIAGIVLSLVSYLIGGDEAYGSEWSTLKIITTLLSLGLSFFILYKASLEHKIKQGGFITFGKAFSISFWVSLVMSILTSIYLYFFFTTMGKGILELIATQQEDVLRERGMDEEQIEKALEITSSFMGPGVMAISGFIAGLFFGLVLGIVIGFIVKRDPPIA